MPDDKPDPEELAKPPEQCEECGSPDVYRIRKLPAYGLFLLIAFGLGLALDQTFAAFLIAVAGSIFFLIAPNWRCAACGNRWSST